MADETQPSLPVPVERLLVANRSEIAIRVFRTAHELGIRKNLPPYVCIPSQPNPYAGSGYLSNAYGPFSLGGDPENAKFNVRDLNLPADIDHQRFANFAKFLPFVAAPLRLQPHLVKDALAAPVRGVCGFLHVPMMRAALNRVNCPNGQCFANANPPCGVLASKPPQACTRPLSGIKFRWLQDGDSLGCLLSQRNPRDLPCRLVP